MSEFQKNFEEFKESLKKMPIGIKILLIVLVLGCIYGIVGSLFVVENNENEKNTTTKESKKLKCKEDWSYMTEYENIFNELYPHGHSVSGLDWKDVRETEEECQYHTTIKIKNAIGVEEKKDLYINTTLDQENKKEHVKSLMVDNIYVYEK